MLACVDVDYREGQTPAAVAAALLFDRWDAEKEQQALLAPMASVAAYIPGSFYLRELPCVLSVLSLAKVSIDVVVIDGYVWLDDAGHKGLGVHLHEALGGKTVVVGVAKTAFATAATIAVPVVRGTSKAPLWVTAEGMSAKDAADLVRTMAGPHRIPTLLRKVDRLCREG